MNLYRFRGFLIRTLVTPLFINLTGSQSGELSTVKWLESVNFNHPFFFFLLSTKRYCAKRQTGET